ncbi:NYN domain-containing protein [Paenibacillus endoradicis]|uniref:NYN domain-containing protein n=1 Tax=Paenibacillus endoradicis TaxID=2972487 RepID=UPI002159689C|nr:NYN domain-containing protein [Paenibacillus endoradicis]MCR8660737.1 NYN domain-containing protein [Paenibacillus endoradicis]
MINRRNDVLLVDGYNMIGAWPELARLKDIGLEEARDKLLHMLADYQGFTGLHVYVIFDAHQMPGIGATYNQHRLTVVYTKEKETADECIERICSEWKSRRRNVYVATSDMMEQHVIFGQGALRMSARELLIEIKQNNVDIKQTITEPATKKRHSIDNRVTDEVWLKLEKLRRGQKPD